MSQEPLLDLDKWLAEAIAVGNEAPTKERAVTHTAWELAIESRKQAARVVRLIAALRAARGQLEEWEQPHEGYFPQLLRMVLRVSGGARYIVVLTAYVDESELRDLRLFGVAGFLWEENAALQFDAEWGEALSDLGIKRFHMSDFESGYGEFVGWSQNRRIEILQRLHKIINDTTLLGVWTTLDLDAYNALNPDEQYALGDPYTACVQFFAARVASSLADKHQRVEPIAYVLDNKGKGKERLMQSFSYLSTSDEYKFLGIESITWAKSLKVRHLQAADLLAYEWTKQSATTLGRQNRPTRASLRNLYVGLGANLRWIS